MNGESGLGSLGGAGRTTRRTVLRTGGALAAAGLSSGLVGTASAQITISAALPTSAPTLSGEDYVGMFLEVTGRSEGEDTSGIENCDLGGEEILAYEVTLINENNREETAESTLYAPASTEVPEAESQFIINSQETCSDEFVSVQLEERPMPDDGDTADGGASGGDDVTTPADAAGEGEQASPGVQTEGTPTPGNADGTTGEETPGGAEGGGDGAPQQTPGGDAQEAGTEAETPGFGIAAAVAGITAAAAALRRVRGE